MKASKELLTKIDALDEKLQNPKAKVSYDILEQKGGAQLYSQLALLFDTVKAADLARRRKGMQGRQYAEQEEAAGTVWWRSGKV